MSEDPTDNHGNGCDCEPDDNDMANELFNALRDSIEDLLSTALGRPVGLRNWVIIAEPMIETEEGNSIPIEPRIITERFMPQWMTRGLLRDGLDGLTRDDLMENFLDILDAEVPGDE